MAPGSQFNKTRFWRRSDAIFIHLSIITMEGFVAYYIAHQTGPAVLLLSIWNSFTTSPATWNKGVLLAVNTISFIIGMIALGWFVRGLWKNFVTDPRKNGGDYSLDKEDVFNIFGSAIILILIFGPDLLNSILMPFVKVFLGNY